MKSLPIVLRVYGEKREGQWSLICLEFNLAVQADTLEEGQAKLQSMVKGYLRDALEGGVDAEYGVELLTRRAPPSFWLKYYFGRAYHCVMGHASKRKVAKEQTVPMQLAGA